MLTAMSGTRRATKFHGTVCCTIYMPGEIRSRRVFARRGILRF
jgi:hypothetical protein